MGVTTAASAGFCFGVKRAVDMVTGALDAGEKVATLGPIINNPQAVESLRARGCEPLDSIDDLPPGYTLVLRSHGVLKEHYDILRKRGIKYLDATCPFVTKIQKTVADFTASADENSLLFVAGDVRHPEVKSFLSFCGVPTIVFENAETLTRKLAEQTEKHGSFDLTRAALIAQTTFNTREWENCVNSIKKVCTNLIIFDTICNATTLRQSEAEMLARNSQKMVVVGGRQSSNTKKLYEICSGLCETIFAETASDLKSEDFIGVGQVGVTAGASTPASIIKEVQARMNEILSDELTFEEMLNLSFKSTYTGEKVTAVVTSVAPNEITVDIGTKHAGYVPLSELTEDPSVKAEDIVKVGDSIELIVLRVNDVEGTVMLSKKKLDAAAGFEKVMEAAETGEVLSGTVTEVIKGGVLAVTNGVRVFIPASQATASRNEPLEELLKKKVDFTILEANRQRRRAVGSVRAVLGAKRKELEEKFWETAQEFAEYEGTVKSLTSYAAFVDLGGLDGMLHISELSWSKLKHPSEVVKVGDKIKVFVKQLDREKRKISLGYAEKGDNPWDAFIRDYSAGMVVKAKIVMLTPFGAFAEIVPGTDGLIHISQISVERIKAPSDVLKVGDVVDVKITDIDEEKRRISLSIKALLEQEDASETEQASETAETSAE